MLEFTLITGDPEKDFLEQNPELRYFPFVQKVCNKHKGRANDILWSLYLVEHPKSKLYYGLPKEETIGIVEKRYKVVYLEDCIPNLEDFCNASMHPHQLHYKLIYDAFKRQLWGLGSMEGTEIMDFFGKLEKAYKSIEIAEDKYTTEEATMQSKFKGDKVQGGLWTTQQDNTLFDKN